MKKHLSMAVMAAVLVTAFTGCGQNAFGSTTTSTSSTSTSTGTSASGSGSASTGKTESASNLSEAGSFPIVKEKATFTVFAPDQPYAGPLKDSDFIKWFEEKTNVHVEFTELPKDALKEKINLSLVSGDMPDVYLACGITNDQQIQYGSRGTFLALNDLIETQGVETKRAMQELPAMSGMITAPDGKIYALPMINDCFHCQYGTRSWINQDWLTAVGMSVPNTTAELEAVLEAFKTKDPNGNGKQDEFPLLGAPTWKGDIIPILMQPFTFTTNRYFNENKKVTFGPNQEAYKEGLIWIRGLIEKGYIDPTSLTQTGDQFIAVMTSGGDTAMVGAAVAFNPNADLSNNVALIKQYVPLPPLEGPKGVRGMMTNAETQAFSGGTFVITNKCKIPEVAFRWADAWYTEEATLNSWCGLEGKGRTTPTSGVGLNGEPALWAPTGIDASTAADPEQLTTVTNMFGYNSKRLREGQLFEPDKGDGKYEVSAFLHFGTQDVFSKYGKPEKTIPPLFWLETEASEYATLTTQIDDYVKEQTTLFLLGEKSIEKDWEKYVGEFEKLGLSRHLEMIQTAYDRQYKK